MAVQAQIIDSFNIPLLYVFNAVDDLENIELLNLCKKEEYLPNSKSSGSDNVDFLKGTKYEDRFVNMFTEIARNLLMIDQCDFKMGVSWTTKTQDGGWSLVHDHKNYFFSSVLYLQDNSKIEFKNPLMSRTHYSFDYSALNPYNSQEITVTPPKNSMVFFPGYLEHSIVLHSGIDRYTISMNYQPVGTYGSMDNRITTN